MQSIQVRSDDDKNTQVSFKTLILRKCQSQFQEDKVRRTKSVNELKEINSCEDPVIHLFLINIICNYIIYNICFISYIYISDRLLCEKFNLFWIL